MTVWCEYCRDHYPAGHFDAEGNHLRTDDAGPMGETLAGLDAARAEVERLRDVARRACDLAAEPAGDVAWTEEVAALRAEIDQPAGGAS